MGHKSFLMATQKLKEKGIFLDAHYMALTETFPAICEEFLGKIFLVGYALTKSGTILKGCQILTPTGGSSG